MSAAADNGNGRVTIAVIGTKLDALLGEVREIKADFKEKCRQIDKQGEDISGIHAEIGNVKHSVRAWNSINSFGIVVAAILAALGIVPRS